MPHTLKGALAPVLTPITKDNRPDARRLTEHCRWLISQDCGLAVFGTNSEGNSLGVDDKVTLLDHLVSEGLPPARMMPGTGTCALADTVKLSRHAAKLGCGGVLMLPPFYYKDVSDEGLFSYVSAVIDGVGDERLRIYLYHIPPVAQVGFSENLIERLITAYPGTIAGIKDSSGNWEHTRAILDRFPGWGIFCGNESRLKEALELGGAGVISATCNINPGTLATLCREWQSADAGEWQEQASALRGVIQSYPMIQALKTVVAHFREDANWHRVLPPLVGLDEVQRASLVKQIMDMGFTMDGLQAAA
ncbi:dihydrodipicolinate synthase family protein [Chelativorans sp. Marseille-P2723]|uniref:dihydrodipicolinate synthase family protein n=1 Tax=Chelativorans sp. Marseille-P2723 TaxID=2709133 RepID=UPI00156DAEC6|nr:dihydrodipicolinate synthase family protein [Chelativorans sp. Marseille-P2723]